MTHFLEKYILHCIILLSFVGTILSLSSNITCDILIAGGSLASAAAAITASSTISNPTKSICFLEITDEPGGQATASGTSAIDFGENFHNFPRNVPKTFGDMLLSSSFGTTPETNPGGCTVSPKCFIPTLASTYILELFSTFPHLHVFLNTAVIATTRNGESITSFTAVQRTPTSFHPSGWDQLLSSSLPDWYSPDDSEYFTKEVITFTLPPNGVVIEATEFGDVLMTSNITKIAQGMEIPTETSEVYDDHCGQASTIVFWTSYSDTLAPSPDPTPIGNDTGYPLSDTWSDSSLAHALIWRRNFAMNRTDTNNVHQGDLFMINEQAGNDLLNAQIFLPLKQAREQVETQNWQGGMNLTAMAMAEERAYAYYWDLKNATSIWMPTMAPFFFINTTASGTTGGLAKMPYLRESRRSQYGIQEFRLCSNFAAINNTGPGEAGCWEPSLQERDASGEKDINSRDTDTNTKNSASTHSLPPHQPPSSSSSSSFPPHLQTSPGFRWVDTIGIGSYGFDEHKFLASYCVYPQYLNYTPDPGPSRPYYLPFRALTVAEVSNLLVAGKSMSMTFLANAVTRLHPTEWVSGVAAGAAASLMVENNWTSVDMYKNYHILEALLKSDMVQSPLEWT